MSTLLDEETVILEALDFDIRCNQGSHSADVIVRCRGCKAGTPLCAEHAELVHSIVDAAIAAGDVVHLVCVGCLRSAWSFDDAVEVVPL